MVTNQEIWVNGEFLPAETPVAGAQDQGLSVGLGVFTTLSISAGKPALLQWHLERLRHDAQVVGLPLLDDVILENALAELVERNALSGMLARGRITLLATLPSRPPLVVITAMPVEHRSGRLKVKTTEFRRNERSPLSGIKATAFAENMLALAQAEAAGAHEALFFNTQEQLCEGATSSVFLVKGEMLLTPSLESGCLPGVIRRWLLHRAPALGLQACEVVLSAADLAAADEVFLTNSLRGIQSVSEIDGRFLSDRTPWADKLQVVYQECRGSGAWL